MGQETRIAVIGIIVEDKNMAGGGQKALPEKGGYIIGGVGGPP